MTAVKGHLRELRFEGDINRDWHSYPLEHLFRVPVIKFVPDRFKALADNLTNEIRFADALFIWTDCDREGEAIGADIADVCLRVKPQLTVWRARFSAMQSNEIHYAAQHPTQLDMRQVEAVRARSELDLRIGAAFTRLQTINLRSYFSSSGNKVLSYGSCQFPTLGFVVDRYLQVQNFIPEEFWKIVMTYVQPTQDNNNNNATEPPIKTTFNWRRDHLFDRWACFVLYEKCFEKKIATVTKVKSKQTSKWKPLPLTTVEMQKVGCRVLNMSGSHLMTIAEGLYTSGLISYPRTETDQYDANFDFMKHINMQTQDSQWGQYARLLRDGEFEKPRNGKNNDKAHPPIHPTSYDAHLSGDPKRVYEFITRRFLASCWKNAIGFETTVEVRMDTEYFDTKGLMILERNFLEVYPYDKWKGNVIPEFHEGDEFIPDQLEMQEGKTSPPRLLTETDLIGMMEKNEIGTDATIAEHIQKILDREYVYKENQYFKPLTLGIALIVGYDKIGLESSLSKPFLRRQV
ncbi:MAG: DNA topoisomerase [Benjaminiella poitrasii]|nr:MAG: DNA topoisomerase [Benjaminiella poitrasii]